MKFKDIIQTRHSIRYFNDQPIGREMQRVPFAHGHQSQPKETLFC